MKAGYAQFDYYHRNLRLLLSYIEERYGFEFTITSQYRINNEGSTHGQLPLRANDLRCRDTEIGYVIESQINAEWMYDPQRPDLKCCIFHDTGSGLHLHVQVHDNTARTS